MLRENITQEISVFTGTDINQLLDLAQKSHEKYLLRANRKDLDAALLYYLEAIKINPAIAEVYYKLASLLWEKGEIDLHSAIKQCKKAVELAPNSSMARLYLGYFLKAAGRYPEAETVFKESIDLAKFKSSKPRLALASTILERLNRTEFNASSFMEAIYFFGSGISMSIYDYDVIKMLYKTTVEKTSVWGYKISADIQKHLHNYKKTVEIYEKAALATERKDLFYSKIGDLYKELQNPHRAADYYRQALRDCPDNISMWIKLAEILQSHDKQNIDEIIECYNNITRLEPMNSRILYEIGHLYLRSENKFNAVTAFKRAIEIEPNNAFYHNSLAYALVQLQDYDGAINEYMIAIRINPDAEWTSIVAQALGAIYHQVKDNLDAAIIAYQTSILLDKKNVDALVALGEAYQDKNDPDNAISCFCNAIQLNANSSRIYSNLGLLLWEKGCTDEAIVAYQKAISINPKSEIGFNNLGVAYLDGKANPVEALKMFNLAVKLNPNYALAYYNVGRTHKMLHNKAEAAKYFQMAIDINKFTQELDEAEVEDTLLGMFSVD
ncbi:MAG: hypothetical protein A2Y25_05780 [Candidatus Melainabacteria bacterium GWF2_37_15]|nr:MAG: hypothetical protein A2Y25_05780 [Candidatus Melainabacteria bacterium GWF2_37_15]